MNRREYTKETSMTWNKSLRVGLLVVCVGVGCKSTGDDDDNDTGGTTQLAAVDSTDVVDVDTILYEDTDGAAAAEVMGDPATLRADALAAAQKATADVRSVVGFIKTVGAGEPDTKGTTRAGQPFGIWEGTVSSADVRFVVVRTAANRLRYLVTARKGTDAYKPLLTGIFIKRLTGAGAGRLHVNLTNASEIFNPTTGYTGSIHFFFANHTHEFRGRRIMYRNIVPRAQPTANPASYAMDIIHKVGLGGRARLMSISPDILPNTGGTDNGTELLAMRVLWKRGVGGRADGLMSRFRPRPVQMYGHFHECWGPAGLRTAYMDTFEANDADNPNQGDVTNCFDLAQDQVPEANTANSDSPADPDPELDAALDETGAADISETDASDATSVNE